jgi:predicted Zn-dependent peptidase
MTQTIQLFPGITLRCVLDYRFKQGVLSIQFVRPMCAEEAAMNALVPAVLLRGCRDYPDIRAITNRLDDLYGASLGNVVRRIGDYQTTGFCCGFMEDRFALAGDRILEPMADLVRRLLLDPVLEDGVFRKDFVEGEKKNLIATLESERNDKRAYALNQLMRILCREDSYGIPRLGEKEAVAEVDPAGLYAHYRRILRESRVELFYVGSWDSDTVAEILKPMFRDMERDYVNLPGQTEFHSVDPEDKTEIMDVTQAKLAMGFLTPITVRDDRFVAMQLFNLIFGAGMTSKLFMNVREKLSLCYDIGSGFSGAKGIVSVSAGIDARQEALVREQILEQLRACQAGEITPEELEAAKRAMFSGIRGIHDTPGSIESFYATAALSARALTPEEHYRAVEAVTVDQVAEAARTLKLHATYILKGVQ